MRCEECKAKDCGSCSNCKDMRKFGGPGRKKKACNIRKLCTELQTEVKF